jgi:hypothetical protein
MEPPFEGGRQMTTSDRADPDHAAHEPPELAQPLGELVEERRRSLGDHPDPRRLLAYRAGELPPEEEEGMREHLSLCDDCLDLLLLHPDSRGGEADVGALDFETHRAWREMRARIREHELRAQLARRTRSLRFLQVAAAVLLLAPGLVWLKARDGAFTHFEPVANAAIFDVQRSQVRGFDVERPGLPAPPARRPSQETATPIAVPQGTAAFTLVFWLDASGFDDYEIVLRDRGGEEIWRSRELKVDLGTATLGLSRRFMDAGEYRVEIFGIDDDGRTLVGEYAIVLSYG